MIILSGLLLMSILAQAAAAPLGAEDDAGKNRREGEAFLAANKRKPGVVTLDSGVQYRILAAGTGSRPRADDAVVCHFRGALIDGTEFSSSKRSKRPAVFPVRKVNKGLAEALQLMPAGSTWQVVIPAALAYGERGVRGHVGPNATVIFDVELIAVKQSAPLAERPRDQQTALKTLRVSFKLDPRLTQGLYMGERRVSPPRFNSAHAGERVTIEAQAVGVDAMGRTRRIDAAWTAADANFVTVAAGAGNTKTVMVNGAGASSIRVEGHGLSTILEVKAAYVGKTLQVEITQGHSVGH